MPRTPASAPSAAYTSALAIHTLSADVRLGAGRKERSALQKISVDVRLYFPALLSSAVSDNGDYICYHDISEKIHELCVSREYRLIEFLIQEIYRLVRGQIPQDVKIWIRLHKHRILLSYVENGSSFTYTDLPPGAWVVPQ